MWKITRKKNKKKNGTGIARVRGEKWRRMSLEEKNRIAWEEEEKRTRGSEGREEEEE